MHCPCYIVYAKKNYYAFHPLGLNVQVFFLQKSVFDLHITQLFSMRGGGAMHLNTPTALSNNSVAAISNSMVKHGLSTPTFNLNLKINFSFSYFMPSVLFGLCINVIVN